MSNPFVKPTQQFFQARNPVAENTVAEMMQRFMNFRRYDARITEINEDNQRRYKCDIFFDGMFDVNSHTLENVEAIALDPLEIYEKQHPARVIYDGRFAYLTGEFHPWRLAITSGQEEDYPNRILAIPHHVDGGVSTPSDDPRILKWVFVDGSIAGGGTDAYFDFTQKTPPVFRNYDNGFWGVRFPHKMKIRDLKLGTDFGDPENHTFYEADGWVLAGGGATLPLRKEKYMALMIVDDDKNIDWDYWRFP